MKRLIIKYLIIALGTVSFLCGKVQPRPRSDPPVPQDWRDQFHESVLSLPLVTESFIDSSESGETTVPWPGYAADASSSIDKLDPHTTGILSSGYLWPRTGTETIVHYSVSKRIEKDQEANIIAALDAIEQQTGSCVQFNKVNETEIKTKAIKAYVLFEIARDDTCGTLIGRRKGGGASANAIRLGTHCFYQIGIIMHEMLHKLGFFHEHSRPDRSDFIRLHHQNIENKMSSQFGRYPDMNTYNLSYDVESIMHYGPLSGAKATNTPSITLRPYFNAGKIKMGQREQLSLTDVKRLLLMYNCSSWDNLDLMLDSIKRSSASDSEPFSLERMNEKEWQHQNISRYCRFPVQRSNEQTVSATKALAISCDSSVLTDYLHRMVSAMSRGPTRPIGIFLYDSKTNIKGSTFRKIADNVVIFLLRSCITENRTRVLQELKFIRLLRFHMSSCNNITIRRQDFSGMDYLKMVAFSNTTIWHLEKDTFVDLPRLRTVSLAYAANLEASLTPDYFEYLIRLHCTPDFCWFRKWMNLNNHLFHSRQLGEIYNVRDSWINSAVSSRLLHLQFDCRTSSIIPSDNDTNLAQFSLNDLLQC